MSNTIKDFTDYLLLEEGLTLDDFYALTRYERVAIENSWKTYKQENSLLSTSSV